MQHDPKAQPRPEPGRLVAVVGNTGVGKTTFVRRLCTAGGLSYGLEQHQERPFQRLFSQDLARYALPNQVDYLLLRAEQEYAIRRSPGVGVVDGGLDEDFFVFTRLFHQQGYLSSAEYTLCERLYYFYRLLLPPPDLFIWLQAPVEIIAGRFVRRQRPLQIAQLDDLHRIEKLLEEWLSPDSCGRLMIVDAAIDDPNYTLAVQKALSIIRQL